MKISDDEKNLVNEAFKVMLEEKRGSVVKRLINDWDKLGVILCALKLAREADFDEPGEYETVQAVGEELLSGVLGDDESWVQLHDYKTPRQIRLFHQCASLPSPIDYDNVEHTWPLVELINLPVTLWSPGTYMQKHDDHVIIWNREGYKPTFTVNLSCNRFYNWTAYRPFAIPSLRAHPHEGLMWYWSMMKTSRDNN